MTINETASYEKPLTKHEGMIYHIVRRYFDDESLVEDAVTYISDKLAENDWQRMRAYKRQSSFKTYLTAVVRNLAADFYRQKLKINQRIDYFQRRFGEAHLYFAYHAAFPLSLTPDLSYRLWINFQRDSTGNTLRNDRGKLLRSSG